MPATQSSLFVRRTYLNEDEYRVNFKQVDCDVLKGLTSKEARKETPLIGHIYLCLINAPLDCWEREGVLRFVGEDREGKSLTAWEQLRELTDVANSTLSKALAYMHKVGIIGYDAHKNGVGIRIFINRAASSIRSVKAQKKLRLVRTPSEIAPAPSDGASFKEDLSRENLDFDINPRAQMRAAGTPSESDEPAPTPTRPEQKGTSVVAAPEVQLNLGRVIEAVKRELEPVIASACEGAIASACRREATLNREWFEKAGLPKAVRVAQHEAFNVLQSYGVMAGRAHHSGDVGRNLEAVEASKGGETENARVATFLAETSMLIRQVATGARASGQLVLHTACQFADQELSQLHDRIISGEELVIQEIEARLETIEKRIAEALWETVDPAEREMMVQSARAELQRYAAGMEAEVFDETVRSRVTAKLRERHRIPRISLSSL